MLSQFPSQFPNSSLSFSSSLNPVCFVSQVAFSLEFLPPICCNSKIHFYFFSSTLPLFASYSIHSPSPILSICDLKIKFFFSGVKKSKRFWKKALKTNEWANEMKWKKKWAKQRRQQINKTVTLLKFISRHKTSHRDWMRRKEFSSWNLSICRRIRIENENKYDKQWRIIRLLSFSISILP